MFLILNHYIILEVYYNNTKRIIFVFVGDGVEKDKLIQRAHNENISNVYFLPPVPKESIPDLLNYFDCS